jgi:hypothetical protein
VVYLHYLGKHENKSRTTIAKAAFNKYKIISPSKLDFNFGKTLVKCYTCSIALYGDEMGAAVGEKTLPTLRLTPLLADLPQ